MTTSVSIKYPKNIQRSRFNWSVVFLPKKRKAMGLSSMIQQQYVIIRPCSFSHVQGKASA
jgi:hypothetical protein